MSPKFKPIKKAIILAAGWGTRFLPLTKVVHKELVPILNKPIIHYLAEEAAKVGIEEIILVISPRKLDIIKYFTLNYPLEVELREKGKKDLLKKVVETNNLVKISIAIQNRQLGLGHAISIAHDLIQNEPFAVILGDDLFVSKTPAIGQLVEAYRQKGHSIIGIQPVSQDKVHNYGIVELENLTDQNQKLFKIKKAIEKPTPKQTSSNLAIMGRYIFSPKMMQILFELKKDWNAKKGELNVVDAFEKLLKEEPIYGFLLEGNRYDLGSIEGFVKANIDLALKDPEIGKSILEHLKHKNFKK